MADAGDLKSLVETHAGSNPAPGTTSVSALWLSLRCVIQRGHRRHPFPVDVRLTCGGEIGSNASTSRSCARLPRWA